MKKLITILTVLMLASFANADLAISVSPPDSNSVYTITISGDGTTEPGQFYIGINAADAGFLNIDSAQILYTGSSTELSWTDSAANAASIGIKNPFVSVELNDLPGEPTIPKIPLDGILVDNIKFQGTAPFTVTLFDSNGVAIATGPEPITANSPGDINHDGTVNYTDLQLVHLNWLKTSPIDLNGDSIVNFKDFAISAQYWLISTH